MSMAFVIPHSNVKQHYSAKQIFVFAVNRTSGMDSFVREVRVIIDIIKSQEHLFEPHLEWTYRGLHDYIL